MKDIDKYLETLIQYSEKKLKKEFKIDKLKFDNFGLINSYLIYQTIKDKKIKKNTLIYLPDKETKSEFYIPVIFTLALYNFIDNYIDNETVFEIGDIVQKNGERYKIEEIRNDKIKLIKKDKYNTTVFSDTEKIKKYILTTENLKNHHIKTKFDLYKRFFSEILELKEKGEKNIELPSKFKYKSIIVTDKKIEKELKNYQIDNNSIHKAFPFRYIAKSGKKTDNIPIAPIIYIVNDYQTARKYILNKGINVRNIIFIGTNKYKDNFLEISEDLSNKRIDNCLFIGSSDIEENAIPKLQKWKWTLTELNYFKYFETFEINPIQIDNNAFSVLLNKFNDIIIKAEQEYGVNLKELYKYVRNILPVVIPYQESRLVKQLDNLLIYFEKEALDIVETAFYEIDEYDYEEIWENILQKFENLIDFKKASHLKFEKIKQFQKIDYLVVPKEYVGIWKEEIKSQKIKNIISFKEYENLECEHRNKKVPCKNKTIVFLGFFGYNHLKSMLFSANRISILLYPEEKLHFSNNLDRYKSETYSLIKKTDRKSISDISFKQTETTETVSDLIKRLFEKNEETKINPDYSTNCEINIVFDFAFENDIEILQLDENKTVLLKINGQERDEKVRNLKIGDKIRVYGNSTKEELYKIALEADTEGIFKEIEQSSHLWKTELLKYYSNFNSVEKLLQNLKNKGLSIKNELTLKNWFTISSNVKFPQKQKDLLVLKKTINSQKLNDNFGNIIKNRKIYNGIMIALGRSFSDELSDFIKTKKKGNILKKFTNIQISEFVEQSVKLRIVKSIKVAKDE